MNEIFSNEANKLYFYCRNRGVLVDPVGDPTAKLVFDRVTEKDITPKKESTGVYYVAINSNDIVDSNDR